MSDSDSDEERVIDWEMLTRTLPPETFAAMKEHFESKQQPKSIDINEAINDSTSSKQQLPNTVFSKREYWEERFEEEESYEWLVKFADVQQIITPLLKQTDSILIVGCGNSSFSKDLYNAGYENIVNIDYSSVLIDKMKLLHAEVCPRMQWIHMDMTKLTFDDESFDVVIDKAAMDALMVDEGDVWYPNSEVIESVDKMCCGVQKVLKPSGIFMQISFAQPHFRTKYLMGYHVTGVSVNPYETHTGYSEKYRWTLTSQSINIEEGCLNSFFYVATKNSNS